MGYIAHMNEPLTAEQLKAAGYNLKALSSNGAFEVVSFIAVRKGRKVYGRWDYTKRAYVEEICTR